MPFLGVVNTGKSRTDRKWMSQATLRSSARLQHSNISKRMLNVYLGDYSPTLVAFPYCREEAKETHLFHVSKEHSSKVNSQSQNPRVPANAQIPSQETTFHVQRQKGHYHLRNEMEM